MTNKINKLKNTFPILSDFLSYNSNIGIHFSGNKIKKRGERQIHKNHLKYYFADSDTSAIISHNLKWAKDECKFPIFQFAYIMLPTLCNQACKGCFMGQDKNTLPEQFKGPHFSEEEMIHILSFLKKHGAKSIVYGGCGELFTWNKAFDFIETISQSGLNLVIFTNGTLLSKEDIFQLNKLNVVLIISLRDTVEIFHNSITGKRNFKAALTAIENALSEKMHLDNRMAVEIPITKENEKRIINDFIPVMRSLNIVPMVEEYIQISVSNEERKNSHNFEQCRNFFQKASEFDKQLGNDWSPDWGTRMINQPQCKRPLYSFAIFPNRNIMDCPSHSISFGNLHNNTLTDIIYSEQFKHYLLNFKFCACSTFYTHNNNDIPKILPKYLEILNEF